MFQRAITNARLVHGYNPQVLIQAGHPWLGGQGCNCLAFPVMVAANRSPPEQPVQLISSICPLATLFLASNTYNNTPHTNTSFTTLQHSYAHLLLELQKRGKFFPFSGTV